MVAAFDPFGGRKRNRAQEAARLLDRHTLGPSVIEMVTLPTVFSALRSATEVLFQPSSRLILLVAESRWAHELLVERLAVNVAHARIADNEGARPIDEEIMPGAEAALRVHFDPRIAANAALAAGVPCEVSSHAGTFCGNAALYWALWHAALSHRPPLVGLVHVPSRLPWARDQRTARGLYAIADRLHKIDSP